MIIIILPETATMARGKGEKMNINDFAGNTGTGGKTNTSDIAGITENSEETAGIIIAISAVTGLRLIARRDRLWFMGTKK
jgi:hypothetical protein